MAARVAQRDGLNTPTKRIGLCGGWLLNEQGEDVSELTRICVTGSECTGKTSLARTLGYHFSVPWVPEAARLFAAQYPGPLGPQTVHSIAELHLALEHRVMAMAQALHEETEETPSVAAPSRAGTSEADVPNPRIQNPKSKIQNLLFLDTDLISTVVYARHYYGGCPPWIEIEARNRRADLYLLCACDIPWQADGIRDLAADRDAVQEKFRATLIEFGCRWFEVSGDLQQRCAIAIDALQTLLPT